MKCNIFPGDFRLHCLKNIVNMPKRAVFTILQFSGIFNHALIFCGTNTYISCFLCKKNIEPDINNQMSHCFAHNEPLKSS